LASLKRSGKPFFAFFCRLMLVYLAFLFILSEIYHTYLDNPYSSWYPWVHKYVEPVFQVVEGIPRMARTLGVCILIGLDYKYHAWKHGPEKWENDMEVRSRVHQRAANLFLDLFRENGCLYIKIGQYLASMKVCKFDCASICRMSQWCVTDTFSSFLTAVRIARRVLPHTARSTGPSTLCGHSSSRKAHF
jgi:hypothetical protein